MTTTQEQVELIRQACITANPSIVDLVFGREVAYELDFGKYRHQKGIFLGADKKWARIYSPDNLSAATRGVVIRTIAELEVIGRPIQLHDVLLAIKVKERPRFESPNHDIDLVVHAWNLLLPLDGQSPELIAFVAGLLHG